MILYKVRSSVLQTEVSRLGTERSSMETLILSCLQAQLIVGRVHKQFLTPQQKNDLIWEIKQVSPKECKLLIDAKVEPKERTNTLNK